MLRAGLIAALLALSGASARAQAPDRDGSFCERPMTRASFLASEASEDLYNAVLWTAGTTAVTFGLEASRRWSRTNGFDRGFRRGLRSDSVSGRESADRASDVMLGLAAGLLPLASIGRTLLERDCEQAWDMTTDALESISLALFFTRSVKRISGRERPSVRACAGTPPADAECSGRDRFRSFVSGHASIAAAGAGVSCAFAIHRKTWGESAAARVLPCALGVGAAVAAGTLRVAADRHWGSDVIVGLGVGAAIGYLDTWGPFDLLRFEVDSGDRARPVRGMILPQAGAGGIGARVALRF